MVKMITMTAPPVKPVMIRLKFSCPVSPKAVSIAVSKVSIDTMAEAKLTTFAAEKTGLLYLRYFTRLTMAFVREKNVYAAMAMVVIG